MFFKSTASKVFALASLSLLIAPIAQAQFKQPSIRPIRELSWDYQAFAPSRPTSGPQAIWKRGSCNNTVRVLVSNIGETIGPSGTVTLTVPEPFYNPEGGDYPVLTMDATYTKSFKPIAPGDHTWIEFTNVDFRSGLGYELSSIVSPEDDENPSNNVRTVSHTINHACS